MIYGQLAKNMSYRGGVIVSESESILKYLQNEVDSYNNMILSESYIDEQERVIMEAKIEALNEAVAGAIIAAIVAAIGALIALIVKLISMMRKGGEKIKGSANDKKSTDDDSTKTSDTEKKYIINQYKYYFNNAEGEADASKLSTKEKEDVLNSIFGSDDDEKSGKYKSISKVDYLKYINSDCVKNLINLVDGVDLGKWVGGSSDTEIPENKMDELIDIMNNEDGKMTKMIFASGVDSSNKKMDEIMKELWDKEIVQPDEIFGKLNGVVYYINELYNKSTKKLEAINKDLAVLKTKFEQIQKRYDKQIRTNIPNPESKINPNIKYVVNNTNAKNGEGKTNSEKYINYLAKVERVSISKLSSFMSSWGTIETRRISTLSKIKVVVNKSLRKLGQKQVYEKYCKEYSWFKSECPDELTPKE
jgi:hypothetical protein